MSVRRDTPDEELPSNSRGCAMIVLLSSVRERSDGKTVPIRPAVDKPNPADLPWADRGPINVPLRGS
jgi:hypothetical protein